MGSHGKICDYLLGSKFHVYMDNSPWAYVRESKLGALPILWLSKLALFSFMIHYWTGRSNTEANALSRHPHSDDDTKIEKGSDCNEVEVISYSSVCEVVDTYLDTTKVLDELKKEVPLISCVVQPTVEEEHAEEIQSILNSVSVLNQVIPEDMAEEQKKNPILGLFCPYITAGEKLKSLVIT